MRTVRVLKNGEAIKFYTGHAAEVSKLAALWKIIFPGCTVEIDPPMMPR